jgi:hypothetical protein
MRHRSLVRYLYVTCAALHARLLAGILVLGLGSMASLPATALELEGAWQGNLVCPAPFGFPEFPATFFLQIEEDASAGAVTALFRPECGAFAVDGGIRPLIGCQTTPLPIPVEVGGDVLRIPPTGSFSIDTTWAPFPSATFMCVEPPLAGSIAELRFELTVQDDGAGKAIRLEGFMSQGATVLYDADGGSCLELTSAPGCTLYLLRNDVPVGAGVVVEPRERTTIAFGEVTAAGVVGITPLSDAAAAVPPGFQLLALPLYYDVTTTAAFVGPVRTCVPYADENDDGVVDGTDPPMDESDIQLLHDEGAVFVDRTVSRDPVANIVCAETASFSQHVLGAPSVPATTTTSTTTTSSSTTTIDDSAAAEPVPIRSFVVTTSDGLTARRLTWSVREELSGGMSLTDDPTADGASLSVRLGATSQCFGLPATGWSALGAFGFKYSDLRGASGPVKAARINKTAAGVFRIKVVILGRNGLVSVVPPGSSGQADMNFRLGSGAEYCASSAGGTLTSTATIFKVTHAPAPTACNIPACVP